MDLDKFEEQIHSIYKGDKAGSEISKWHVQYIYELLLIREMNKKVVAEDLLKTAIELINVEHGNDGLLDLAENLRQIASNIEVRVQHDQFYSKARMDHATNDNSLSSCLPPLS